MSVINIDVFGIHKNRLAWILWKFDNERKKVPFSYDQNRVVRIYDAICPSYEYVRSIIDKNSELGCGICISRYVSDTNNPTELFCVDDDSVERSGINMFSQFKDRVLVDTSPSGKNHYWFYMSVEEQRVLMSIRERLGLKVYHHGSNIDLFYGIGSERYVTVTGKYRSMPTNGTIGYLTAYEVMSALPSVMCEAPRTTTMEEPVEVDVYSSVQEDTSTEERTYAYSTVAYEFMPLPKYTVARIPSGFSDGLFEFFSRAPVANDDIISVYRTCFPTSRVARNPSVIRMRICYLLTYYYGLRKNLLSEQMHKLFPGEKASRDIDDYIVPKAMFERVRCILNSDSTYPPYKGVNKQERDFCIACIRAGESPLQKYIETRNELGKTFLSYDVKRQAANKRRALMMDIQTLTSYTPEVYAYSLLSHKEIVELWGPTNKAIEETTPREYATAYEAVTRCSPVSAAHHGKGVTTRYLCRLPTFIKDGHEATYSPNSRTVKKVAEQICTARREYEQSRIETVVNKSKTLLETYSSEQLSDAEDALRELTEYDANGMYSMISYSEIVSLYHKYKPCLVNLSKAQFRKVYRKVTGIAPVTCSHHRGSCSPRFLLRLPPTIDDEQAKAFCANDKTVERVRKRIINRWP